jgi:arsenate reductase
VVGDKPKRVLFLCTGNSCRSQMAEGWVRALFPGEIEARSAGVAPKGLDPRAERVMREAGVDIAGQRSEHVDAFAGERFDLVVTVCDHAAERCPRFPGAARTLHAPFDDPPHLAAGTATGEEVLRPYRRVRDEIRAWVEGLPERIAPGCR